jgi:hypothetical protein
VTPHSFDIDPHSPTLTVHNPQLFDAAEGVASSFGIGDVSRIADHLLIRRANVDDQALLGQLLADRTILTDRGSSPADDARAE